jgi:hypothetical protein
MNAQKSDPTKQGASSLKSADNVKVVCFVIFAMGFSGALLDISDNILILIFSESFARYRFKTEANTQPQTLSSATDVRSEPREYS